MDHKKGIRIGTFYSELMHQEITIPKGFEATIEGNKIILAKTESEDERIRKALITFFKRFPYTNLYDNSLSAKNVIAWLERQAQKEEHQIYRTEDGEIITYSEADGYKHVEQKFKVGDWIVHNDANVYRVKKIDYTKTIPRYELENIYGDKLSIPFTSDYNLRNWTIQDAKDGDVLADKDNNIGFFKNIDGIYWDSYIYIGCDGELRGFSIGGKHEQTDTHPATKEQREQLEKAMTDAGHTFDFEKKELKKIEQDSTEFGENRSKELSLSLQIQSYLNTASDELYAKGKPLYSEERLEEIHECMSMWAKLHHAYFYQKPAWSEEDEIIYAELIKYFESLTNCLATKERHNENRRWLNWLKSIKGRVQPQHKQDGHTKLSEEKDIDEEHKIGKVFTGLIPCWINAPSTLQAEHSNHGKNVVAIHLKGGGYRCCCIDDEKPRTFYVAENTFLVEGWHNRESFVWSEEDDYNLQCWIAKAVNDIQNGNVGRNQELIDWLKALKDRVQPQPKQEWGEDDEEMVQIIKSQLSGTIAGITLPMLSWFNSLKERISCKN